MASASPVSDAGVTGVFLQFGVLGALCLMALWFFLTVYKREVQRADRAEAALAALNADIRDKVIPALTDAVRVTAETRDFLRDQRR